MLIKYLFVCLFVCLSRTNCRLLSDYLKFLLPYIYTNLYVTQINNYFATDFEEIKGTPIGLGLSARPIRLHTAKTFGCEK